MDSAKLIEIMLSTEKSHFSYKIAVALVFQAFKADIL